MTTPTDLFSDLPAPIARALTARGFTQLTPVQRAVIEAEHAGRDLRISSQTGSGKTVAIGLALAAHFLDASRSLDAGRSAPPNAPPTETANATPDATPSDGTPSDKKVEHERARPLGPAAMRTRGSADPAAHPRALVIVPTRELAAQVRDELAWLFAGLPGATVEVVTGGTSVLRERIALARKPAFVVGTPGRLLDHMRGEALACDAIEHVILDEADQMLDMGFKDELDAILEQLPEKRASHLVSATFPAAVKALADRFQRDALTVEGTKPGDAHPDIEHVAHAIRRAGTYAALVNVLLLAGDSRCLLFVNRRVDAVELAERLAADGFGAAPFSGELPQAQRTRTLAAFRSGVLPILVSTDVAARGIDVPEIGTVIHVDPPRNAAAYVHRSGRTGRAGRTGRSILLVDVAESRRVVRMLDATGIAIDWRPVPTRDRVGAHLDGRARRVLGERLDGFEVSEPQRIAAKQLLTERDPVELVAALVELAKPTPPHAPMEVEVVDFWHDAGRGRRGRNERRERSGRADSPRSAPRSAPRREPRSAGGFQPFNVSWGERTGATTARLVSHVCRRGGITGEQVGAIRVFGKSSIVEIASDVAEAFAARARQPDERDPGITIERAVPRTRDPRDLRKERDTRGDLAGRPRDVRGERLDPAGGMRSEGPARTRAPKSERAARTRAAASERPGPIERGGRAREARGDFEDRSRPERAGRRTHARREEREARPTGPAGAVRSGPRGQTYRARRLTVGEIAAQALERHEVARTTTRPGSPKRARKSIPPARRVSGPEATTSRGEPGARGAAGPRAFEGPRPARKGKPKGAPAGPKRPGPFGPASRKRR